MNEWKSQNKRREEYLKHVKDIRKRNRWNQVFIVILALFIVIPIILTFFK